MTEWWVKPFKLTVDGNPWAILTDQAFLIAIQGDSKLPTSTAPQEVDKSIARMLKLNPKDFKRTSVQRFREFLGTDEEVYVLGMVLDTEKLLRVTEKLKAPHVELWDASQHFHEKCLGLVVAPKWRAFQMALKGVKEDPPIPVYEFESNNPLAEFPGEE